jgi:phosphoglycolate phosphatase-like HAD superfamily hydrolase
MFTGDVTRIGRKKESLWEKGMIRAVVFDFDGVLAESVDTKTRAYASLFEGECDEVVQRVVAYHLAHGGVSRYEKFKYIYREILCRPLSKEKFHSLCDDFSKLVVDAVVSARWVDGAKDFLENNQNAYQFFIKNNEMVFVGDASTDWEAAKVTGIQFVWRRISSDAPPLIGFDGPIISDLYQLKDCLDKVAS